ncbi:leucyl aminopeptidase [Yoonia sp. 208BN28-4]|uniref:leucyl aminopeptidase n=1 Tax=Yoonia sp. 208BN28-4 TaxID=3126505 RepID=UPI00309FC499
MTTVCPYTITAASVDTLADLGGQIAVLVSLNGQLGGLGTQLDARMHGALSGAVNSPAFEKASAGDCLTIGFPSGIAADAVLVVKLGADATQDEARKAGAALAKAKGDKSLHVLASDMARLTDLALGLLLRDYRFDAHMTKAPDPRGHIDFCVDDPEAARDKIAAAKDIAEGVFFTRDLTNEPANVLTTTDFADRLKAMEDIGLTVEVLEEDELERLGMGALLCVGQGSDSPTKVVVMQWNGGTEGEAPFALVGKGVVFDTGGISLKPGAGMWDMTMDMGGAGVVSGVMKTLALRKAKANVVGLVGIVENMPSGNAVRPGDVVTSMKGDTIEVQNTDAEGRLVLADVLWYAQDRFAPTGMINLATLTGAMVVALGHENAGVFSNDDTLCDAFLKAAASESEGAWRMPLGDAYDALLKSRVADMKNIGGRPAGSITAAQFLKRFVKDDMPWCHLDIAGVASRSSQTNLAPAGATGWGVMALNRLIAEHYEG